MQECFPVEERCRQQRALIPGSARTAAIRGCVLSQNCRSSDKHRQEEHFRNNPFCLWCQSLLLIYPQSELLCVTSYCGFQNHLCPPFLPTLGVQRSVFSRVTFQLRPCVPEFVSSGALHPSLCLLYAVHGCKHSM